MNRYEDLLRHVVLQTDNNNHKKLKKIVLLLTDTMLRLLVWNIFYITSFISTGCKKKRLHLKIV